MFELGWYELSTTPFKILFDKKFVLFIGKVVKDETEKKIKETQKKWKIIIE